MDDPMSWEAFQALPPAEIRPFAPPTLICTLGGTRRAAAFAGIEPSTPAYIRWSRQAMLRWFAIVADYGVRHVFLAAARATEFKETGRHARTLGILDEVIADDAMLRAYAEQGWRARVIGDPADPGIQRIAERFRSRQPAAWRFTLWYMIIPSFDALWTWMCQAIVAAGATSRAAAIEALYGEPVPPATLLISSGKPIVAADLVPPLLADELQCYWAQRPGYTLGELDFRSILYDSALTRATWRQNKQGRAEAARAHQERWQRAGILGLGQRLGPFWFPRPVEEPADPQPASLLPAHAEDRA